LRPFDGRIVTLPPFILYGPVSHYLGRLAAALGDWQRAARHFDEALRLAGRAHARRWLARTQVAYATMLLERRERADVLLARGLLSAAGHIAADLGMEGLGRQVERLQACRDDPGPPPPSPVALRVVEGPPVGEFRREGEFWRLGFDGKRTLVRDTRGLQYLHVLLERPGEQVPALWLVGGLGSENGGGMAVQSGIPVGGDGPAVVDYRRRLRELASEIPEAKARGDLGLAEQLSEESEILQDEIGRSRGFGGRPRVAGDKADLARQNVQKRIKRVYTKLQGTMPELVHHLETHVKTGTSVVYRPDPARPVIWRTR
jgi:hypothetical protein